MQILTKGDGEYPYLGALGRYPMLLGLTPRGRLEIDELHRCLLQGADTPLSVPVAGGRAYLKKERSAHPLLISGHGDWRRIHLGAISAQYGRTPYFRHYFPEIESIILLYGNPDASLHLLNKSLHEAVCRMIFRTEDLHAVTEMREKRPDIFRAVATEISDKTDPSLSVVDALFRLGPDTIFSVIPPLSMST